MAKRSAPKTRRARSGRKARNIPPEDDVKPAEKIPSPPTLPGRTPLGMERATIPPALNDDSRREKLKMKANSSEPDDYMIERVRVRDRLQ